jgi:cytochrome c oxidase cbb3-type subunit III
MKQRKFSGFVALICLTCWLSFLAGCNNEGNPTPPAPGDGNQAAPPAPKEVTREEAQRLFKGRCVACHGEDGKGRKEVAPQVPDFTDPEWQAKKKDEDFIRSINDGIGTGTGAMPRWSKLLTPEQVKALAKYVRDYAKK